MLPLPFFSLFLFLFFSPFASSFSLLYSFVRSFEFYFPLDNCVRTFVCILPSGVQMRMALYLTCPSFDTFTFCIKLLRNHAGRCSLFNILGKWRSPLVIALLLPYLYSSNNKIICFFSLHIFNLLKFHLFYLFTHQNRREKQETKKATTQLKFVFGISRYFSYILGTCILYKCRSHVQLHWNPLFLSAHSMRLLIR